MDGKRQLKLRLLFSLLSFILSVHFAQIYSQSASKIDSLKSMIVGREGIEKIEALIALGREYFNVMGDNSNALICLDQAQKVSFEIGDSVRIVKTSRMKGQALAKMERVDESLYALYYVLPIARRHNLETEIMRIIGTVGMNLIFTAKYDRALMYLQESYALREKNNDKEGMHIVLNNIGVVFYKMKSYKKAFDYFQESLRIKEEIQDFFDFDTVLINSGLCQVYLDNYSEALYLLNKGLNFCGGSCNSFVESNGYFGLGVLHFRQNDLTTAKLNFIRSYHSALDGNYMRFQADNLVYLGKISFALGKRQEGIDQLTEAEEISKTKEYNELLITVYEELIKMFKSMNNNSQLSDYQKKLIELREKVYSATMVENLTASEAKLKSQENEMILSHQQATLKLNSQLIDKNRALIMSACGIAILFGLLLSMLFWSNLKNKRLSEELELNVAERTRELTGLVAQLSQIQKKQGVQIEKSHEVILTHSLTLRGLHRIIETEVEVNWNQQMGTTLDQLNRIASKDLVTDEI